MIRPWSLWSAPQDIARNTARVSQAWEREIVRDPYLRQVLTVVEVVFGDLTRWRFSTDAIELYADDGTPRHVLPGLQEEPEILDEYELLNPNSNVRSLSVTLPAALVDLPERRAHGFPLQGWAEVSLIAPGMSWNDRRVVLRGDMAGGVRLGVVRDGRTSADGQPNTRDRQTFTFTVEDPRLAADTSFPPALASEETWSDVHPGAVGQPYPVVYGTASVTCVRVSTSTGTPTFVVAYGHGWDVQTIFLNGDNVTADFTVNDAAYDDQGNPVTTITAIAALHVFEDGDRVQAYVQQGASNPDLIDTIQDVVDRFGAGGVAVRSRQLFGDARAKLGSLRAIAQANDRAGLLQFIEENLLESFPMVGMTWAGSGYGPIVTDYRTQPRLHLRNYGPAIYHRLTEPVESPKAELFTSFTLRYRYDIRLDQFRGLKEIHPGNDHRCAVARRILDTDRAYPEILALGIEDDLTAAFVADWLADHLTTPTLYLEYAAAPRLFFELRPGDTVHLDDDDHQFAAEHATVERLGYRRGFCTLGLRVWCYRSRPPSAL